MKINWILPELSKSGGVRVALQYANKLSDMGHDVICYVPQSGLHYGWKKIFFLKDVIKMRTRDELRGKWFDNRFRFEFPLWINDRSVRNADVTIATSWITSYWVNRLHKGKKLYFIQDFETWGNSKINAAVLKSYKLPFDDFIVVSSALHNRLLETVGTDTKVVCNGIEEIFLSDIPKPINLNGDVVVGMPYRENRGDDIKNCALGIRVMLKLKKRFPSIKLVSYGFKKPEHWSDEIEFVENPTRKELLSFYNKTDIFYVPSKYEGWGLPAMEAMAQRSAVLAHCSGFIQEIGIDNENCIMLNDPSDEKEALEKISNLILNETKRRTIGNNARKVVSNMTVQSSALNFENILCLLCQKTN